MVLVRENARQVLLLDVPQVVQQIVERYVKGMLLLSHHHAIIVVNLSAMVHVHQHAPLKQRDKMTVY